MEYQLATVFFISASLYWQFYILDWKQNFNNQRGVLCSNRQAYFAVQIHRSDLNVI